jgi:aspartyl-tRNA(Asn)/glutamyl-tRNA(Gln) amidotransferase subunit C
LFSSAIVKTLPGNLLYYDEMAKLTKDDVLKLAQLARLCVSDSEVIRYQDEINKILGYVEQLQDIDVTNVEPTSQVTGLHNVVRKDVISPSSSTPAELLQNAPEVTEDGYIKVKRMIT